MCVYWIQWFYSRLLVHKLQKHIKLQVIQLNIKLKTLRKCCASSVAKYWSYILTILFIITFVELVTVHIRLNTYFLINILQVGSCLDINIRLALQFLVSLHKNLKTLLYETISFRKVSVLYIVHNGDVYWVLWSSAEYCIKFTKTNILAG